MSEKVAVLGNRTDLEELAEALVEAGCKIQELRLKGNYLRIEKDHAWFSDNDIYSDKTYTLTPKP